MKLLRLIKQIIFLLKPLKNSFLNQKQGCIGLKKISFNSNLSLCILGNGPSLKKDKLTLKQHDDKTDFCCVNHFAEDDIYVVLRPKYYFFADEYFFIDDVHPKWVEKREKTFKKINDETTWKMQIFIPCTADILVLQKFITNKFISINKLNLQSVNHNSKNILGKYLFNTGRFGPMFHNVIPYCMYVFMFANYKNIYLYGADMSFHKDIEVDQKTNELLFTSKHFNEPDTKEVLRKNPYLVEKWSMSEILYSSYLVFKSHETIKDYADLKGINIINSSSHSLIDAYKRENSEE